jgi:hypothetical protein
MLWALPFIVFAVVAIILLVGAVLVQIVIQMCDCYDDDD